MKLLLCVAVCMALCLPALADVPCGQVTIDECADKVFVGGKFKYPPSTKSTSGTQVELTITSQNGTTGADSWRIYKADKACNGFDDKCTSFCFCGKDRSVEGNFCVGGSTADSFTTGTSANSFPDKEDTYAYVLRKIDGKTDCAITVDFNLGKLGDNQPATCVTELKKTDYCGDEPADSASFAVLSVLSVVMAAFALVF